jgi:hypothetical protein
MKLWRVVIVCLPIIALLSLSMTSTAQAQEFLAVPPEIANVLVKAGVIIDGVLGHWVSGNALTVDGGAFVNAIAQTVVNTTHFFATACYSVLIT